MLLLLVTLVEPSLLREPRRLRLLRDYAVVDHKRYICIAKRRKEQRSPWPVRDEPSRGRRCASVCRCGSAARNDLRCGRQNSRAAFTAAAAIAAGAAWAGQGTNRGGEVQVSRGVAVHYGAERRGRHLPHGSCGKILRFHGRRVPEPRRSALGFE